MLATDALTLFRRLAVELSMYDDGKARVYLIKHRRGRTGRATIDGNLSSVELSSPNYATSAKGPGVSAVCVGGRMMMSYRLAQFIIPVEIYCCMLT